MFFFFLNALYNNWRTKLARKYDYHNKHNHITVSPSTHLNHVCLLLIAYSREFNLKEIMIVSMLRNVYEVIISTCHAKHF